MSDVKKKDYPCYKMEQAGTVLGIEYDEVKTILIGLKRAAQDLNVMDKFPFTGFLGAQTSIDFNGEYFFGCFSGPFTVDPEPLQLEDCKELLLGAGGCENFSMDALLATAQQMAVVKQLNELTDVQLKAFEQFTYEVMRITTFNALPTMLKLYHTAETDLDHDDLPDDLYRQGDRIYYLHDGCELNINSSLLQLALNPYLPF